ncbi:MAG TPA: hypothetical protein VHM23_04780 [Actinomycetota bacterium]|jgi:hypothetical protein|nr:hypothetical protein [Actinomycetota bacterium]
MFKLARALMLMVVLAAMSLAAMAAVAQAHTSSDPATDQSSRQADATVQRLLARERSSIPDTGHPRLLLDEDRSSLLNLPSAGPAQAPSPVRPAAHNDQPGWLTPALAALALLFAFTTAIAVLVIRRTNRVQRASQTA